MTNAKKPSSAVVTATIAINRESPRPFRKVTRLCTNCPSDSAPGADWAIIAYGMVSIWLTKVMGRRESSKRKKSASRDEADFPQMPANPGQGLLAILLDPGRAQPRKAVLIDGELPGQEFVYGQRVAAAGLLEGEQTAANRGDDFGLAADDPPLGSGCGQIRDRQRT